MEAGEYFIGGFMKKLVPVSGHVVEEIARNFSAKDYLKNEFLLKQGQISNAFYFLEEGMVRSYAYDTDGNEVTTGFTSQPAVVFEVASYFKRKPTTENIQALTDCKGWSCDYETFQRLFHAIREFREFGRANLVNGFVALKERNLAMIQLTAEQRYAALVHARPEIFQHAPLKQIASFLGITDTSLSRIRKELTRK